MRNIQMEIQVSPLRRTPVQLYIDFLEDYLPDPFVIAIGVTIVVAVLAACIAPHGTAATIVVSWYNGLFGILTFAIQMILILVTGHALASTPLVTRGLKRLVALCRTPNQAMVMTFLVTCAGSWINWGFGLVIGAMLAREVARHIRIDFGWLVAAAYAGWMPWCIGPSSSIPLAQASHGNPLNIVEKVTGHLLPFSDTIFTASSIVPTLIIVALIPVAFILAAPPSESVVVAKFLDDVTATSQPEVSPAKRGLIRRFERSRICNVILVAAGVAYFAVSWSTGIFAFDISAVIFVFLMLGLALHPSPLAYLEAVQDGAKQTGGMMLQFPLYGGIMGIMTATGLAGVIAHFFVTMASAQTLPIWSYVSSLLITFLVPSAGGHWAVQGPFVVQAVTGLHASMAETAMAVAKGEAAANMVQPFWALPVVAMAGIGIQRVMGFMIVAFLVSVVVYAVQILWF
jgi:short-chain fatty acids transporter